MVEMVRYFSKATAVLDTPPRWCAGLFVLIRRLRILTVVLVLAVICLDRFGGLLCGRTEVLLSYALLFGTDKVMMRDLFIVDSTEAIVARDASFCLVSCVPVVL